MQSSPIIQLLVLAGIAIFLILRLRSVLGTREGFEKPSVPAPAEEKRRARPEFEVIEGGPDRDITDHVPEDSEAAKALAAMKAIDPTFNVREFLQGARQAYEMILMGFEKGDLASVRGFLSDDVFDAFDSVVRTREEQGLRIEATLVGVGDVKLMNATFDRSTREGEVAVRFVGELTWQVRDRDGNVVEGNLNEIKRQRDVWTFARVMGTDDPNWLLVATSE